MEHKKKILNRITIVFILMIIMSIVIVVKIAIVQFGEGKFWKKLSDSLHIMAKPIQSERGTIFSEDGNILSASLPFYDMYIDFNAPLIKENKGKYFKQKVDSLAWGFNKIFKDKSIEDYKNELLLGYKSKHHYYLFHKKISYQELQFIKNLPLINIAKNKYSSGFIFETKDKRVYPFGQLANRTIGFLRDSVNWNLGLEKSYDSVLRGESGYRLMKYISGGVFIPVDDYNILPKNGKDIVTTLNTKIQDIVQNSLLNMLEKNEADWGTCIVMEVATGKIKAIANLTKQNNDSGYIENFNYAIKRYEPGSTFKLVSMLALLEDKYITLNDQVDLNGGEFAFAKDVVMYDSEKHNVRKTSIKNAFAISSNVGISRIINKYYNKHPDDFINYIKKVNLNTKTNFDLSSEESSPIIQNPHKKLWSSVTSLPWMSIGYGIEITPLQTLMLYNAIANNGKMMKPYLVSKFLNQEMVVVKEINPIQISNKICSEQTLIELKKLLKLVVDSGTAKSVFKNSSYSVAGKTGTNLFYELKKGYQDSVYMASFVGYFPAENPIYSCIVVIKNKHNALKYYGASIAAPVFRDIADKLMAIKDNINEDGLKTENIETKLKSTTNNLENTTIFKLKNNLNNIKTMPNIIGLPLNEAITILENLNVKIEISGSGIVKSQNIKNGEILNSNSVVKIILD